MQDRCFAQLAADRIDVGVDRARGHGGVAPQCIEELFAAPRASRLHGQTEEHPEFVRGEVEGSVLAETHPQTRRVEGERATLDLTHVAPAPGQTRLHPRP